MNPSDSEAARSQAPAAVPPATAAGYAWGPWARGAASLAVAWHLVGVMVAPISVSPQMNRGDSVIGAEMKKVYRPYITAAFLDHSYKFFAPNPGDSHLLRYDLFFADGSSRVNRDDQILPDRLGHWPRLLYHRHFMLTEFINLPEIWMLDSVPPELLGGTATAAGQATGATPTGNAASGPVAPLVLAPPTAAPSARERIPIVDLLEKLAREPVPGAGRPAGTEPVVAGQGGESLGPERLAANAEPRPLPPVVDYWRAAAAYLARKHGAARVDLYYRKHILASIDDYRRVGRLDPPESYVERLLVSYRTGEPAGGGK